MPLRLQYVVLFSALDFRNEVLDSVLQTWRWEKDLLGKFGVLLFPDSKHCNSCFRRYLTGNEYQAKRSFFLNAYLDSDIFVCRSS